MGLLHSETSTRDSTVTIAAVPHCYIVSPVLRLVLLLSAAAARSGPHARIEPTRPSLRAVEQAVRVSLPSESIKFSDIIRAGSGAGRGARRSRGRLHGGHVHHKRLHGGTCGHVELLAVRYAP